MPDYIQFVELSRESPEHRTRRWMVVSVDGAMLGTVKWYTASRRYGFWPKEDTVFECVCLRRIALFCEVQTDQRKLDRAEEKRAGYFGRKQDKEAVPHVPHL